MRKFIRGALQAQPGRRIIAMSGGGRIRNTEFLDLAKKVAASLETASRPAPKIVIE